MADEISCGAIVFTYENAERKYVIVRGTGMYKRNDSLDKMLFLAGGAYEDSDYVRECLLTYCMEMP